MLIRSYFDIDNIDELDKDRFAEIYAEALFLEEREIEKMTVAVNNAIAKAFGVD